jgi:uncharacterized membrane protein required for colicin V production
MFDTLLQNPWMINGLIVLFILLRFREGLKKGFLLQLFELLSLGIALLFATTLMPWASERWMIISFQDATIDVSIIESMLQGANQIVWFFILFAIGSILMLLFIPLVKVISNIPLLKPINALFGSLFSFVGSWIWLFVISLVLLLPWFSFGPSVVNSTWLSPIQSLTLTLIEDERVKESFEASKDLFTYISQPQELDEESKTRLKSWLLQLGIDEAIIDEFLERSETNE